MVVESYSLLALAVQIGLTTAIEGNFTYGCPTLDAGSAFNDSLVRWVTLTCPGEPALKLTPSQFSCGAHENSCTEIFPTFTPPPGLLGLFLVDHGSQNCPNSYYPSATHSTLMSGERILAYSPEVPLDYCAVVKRSAGLLESFNVEWTPGFGIQRDNRILLSATNGIATSGGSATLTVQASDPFGFDVTVSFGIGFVLPYTVFRAISISPASILVRAGGSNSTVVTFDASPGQTPGTYEVEIDATPVYGLRFYGDYAFTPGDIENSFYPTVTLP